jgi:hypothetical protein
MHFKNETITIEKAKSATMDIIFSVPTIYFGFLILYFAIFGFPMKGTDLNILYFLLGINGIYWILYPIYCLFKGWK